MKGYVLAAAHNRKDRNDAKGAFHVGARVFSRIYGLPKSLFTNDEGTASRAEVLKKMKAQAGGWDVLAYFGHGDWNAISSAGFRNDDGAKTFATAIKERANAGIKVLLYACNTGAPGGFASWLAGHLKENRATVHGHRPPAGHAFKSPRVVVYGPGLPADGQLIIPSTSYLYSEWIAALSSEQSDLWARFPWMTQAEIEQEL